MTMKATGWFEVDREGLAKLCERRGKAFVIHELVANAWDTGARHVTVDLRALPDGLTASLSVEDDDPDGFRDIRHAYTLFAESEKKPDATKRGRFNLGEKLVLALCAEARVLSTTGSVRFDPVDGRVDAPDERRERGSIFLATIHMTKDEVERAAEAVRAMLPPEGVETTFNGETLRRREPLKAVDATLHTEISDARGILRRTERKTKVEIHSVKPGEVASIYEMGVPVVETGDQFHVNVLQKVPLTVERDNVLPAYLRDVRAVALNAMAKSLTADDAGEGWVAAALEDEQVTKDAVNAALTARFGELRVAADPADREAENRAKGNGYTVIPSGAFSREAWKNIRANEGVQRAGQVFPTPRPDDREGTGAPKKIIAEADWTDGMRAVAKYACEVGHRLLGKDAAVVMADDRSWPFAATWQNASLGRSGPTLTFNAGRLGKSWFAAGNREAINSTLIHEIGHAEESNHLDSGYHEALCDMGAALVELCLSDPMVPALLSTPGGARKRAKRIDRPEAFAAARRGKGHVR